MSLYALQKLIRDINRDPDVRSSFIASPQAVASSRKLSETEAHALVNRDYGTLYRLGVHGLLLRPFSIIHNVAEPDYLTAIRGAPQ